MARNNKSTDVGYRWQHFHPALRLDHVLTVKAKREEPMRVFFGQSSSLDGACGIHSVCMALVILQLAKSSALSEASHRKYGVAADLWKELGDTYFAGVEPPVLVDRLSRLDLPWRISARFATDKRIDNFAIENLRVGQLVMLAFHSVKSRTGTRHWSLAVGVGGTIIKRERIADTIFLVDPSEHEPQFSLFNSRLAIYEPRPNSRQIAKRSKPMIWNYSCGWGGEPVRLVGAIRLSRA